MLHFQSKPILSLQASKKVLTTSYDPLSEPPCGFDLDPNVWDPVRVYDGSNSLQVDFAFDKTQGFAFPQPTQPGPTQYTFTAELTDSENYIKSVSGTVQGPLSVTIAVQQYREVTVTSEGSIEYREEGYNPVPLESQTENVSMVRET